MQGEAQVLDVHLVRLARPVLLDLGRRNRHGCSQTFAHAVGQHLAPLLFDERTRGHAQLVLHELAEALVRKHAILIEHGRLLFAPEPDELGIGDQILDLLVADPEASLAMISRSISRSMTVS